MRYVNLKKKNQTLLETKTKRFAIISMFCLLICSFVVLPLTKNVQDASARQQENETELQNLKFDDVQNGEIVNENFEFLV